MPLKWRARSTAASMIAVVVPTRNNVFHIPAAGSEQVFQIGEIVARGNTDDAALFGLGAWRCPKTAFFGPRSNLQALIDAALEEYLPENVRVISNVLCKRTRSGGKSWDPDDYHRSPN